MNKVYRRWLGAGVFFVGVAGLGACSDDDDDLQGMASSGAGQGGDGSSLAGAGSTSAGSGMKPSGGDDGGPRGGVGGDAATANAGAAAEAGAGGHLGHGGAADAAGTAGTDGGGQSTAGAGGDGGTGPNGDAGLCDGAESIVPTVAPSCSLTNDEPTCRGCLKTKACSAWQDCYGDQPRSACGYAAQLEDPGQFDCIAFCFADGASASVDPSELLASCASSCENQCEELNSATHVLLAAANEDCATECFPF